MLALNVTKYFQEASHSYLTPLASTSDLVGLCSQTGRITGEPNGTQISIIDLIGDLHTEQTSICHFCYDVIFEIKNITGFLGGGAALRLELRAFTLVRLVLLTHDPLCQPLGIILYKLKK
jgi:hypothetical protein